MSGAKKRVIVAFLSCEGDRCSDAQELPDGWDAMSDEEQRRHLDEVAQDFISGRYEYGAYVTDADGAS